MTLFQFRLPRTSSALFVGSAGFPLGLGDFGRGRVTAWPAGGAALPAGSAGRVGTATSVGAGGAGGGGVTTAGGGATGTGAAIGGAAAGAAIAGAGS